MFVPNASAEKWKPHYLDTDWEPFCQITFASYVDNVFVAAKDVPSFLKLAGAFEAELNETWNQKIKPSSREYVVPKGVRFGKDNLNVWKHAEKFKALGITLQNNGETNLTWEDTEKQAWRI